MLIFTISAEISKIRIRSFSFIFKIKQTANLFPHHISSKSKKMLPVLALLQSSITIIIFTIC